MAKIQTCPSCQGVLSFLCFFGRGNVKRFKCASCQKLFEAEDENNPDWREVQPGYVIRTEGPTQVLPRLD